MTPMETVEIALERAGSRRQRPGEWTCPAHDDQHASLSVKEGRDGRVLLNCHANCEFETVVAALKLEVADLFPAKPDQGSGDDWTPAGPAIATYLYTDAKGKTLFGVCRTADKQFRQWRPDPSKKHGRAWSLGNVKPVLYQLPKVLAAIDDGEPIYVAEGEKDVHALEAKGVTATCNPMGAGKWRAMYSKTLASATVIVIADNDAPGRKHAREVAASLTDASCAVRLVRAAEGKDAADHLAADHGVDEFVDLEDEPEPEAAAAPSEDLPKIALEEGDRLLRQVETFLCRFVRFTGKAQQVAVTLHVVHTWCFEAAETTPYLHVSSPEKESGKTRLIEVLAQLERGALQSADMTAAALYRSIEDPAPVLLFDEVQELFARDADTDQRQLRACLHSGYRLGGAARRVVGDGTNQTVKAFPTFCPKVLAGTGSLPDMLASRSVPIRLQRTTKGEQPEKFRIRRVRGETEALRRRLGGWAQTAVPVLEGLDPKLPTVLSARQEDCWEPLIAIADLARGSWPQRARDAAIELHGHDPTAEPTIGVLALTHIREAFSALDDEGRFVDWACQRLPSELLLRLLVDRDDGPWSEWWAKYLKDDDTRTPAHRLAKLLKPYDIGPKKLDIDGRKARGYDREWFAKAWESYLPPWQPPPDSEPRNPAGQSADGDGTEDEPVPSPQAADQEGSEVPLPETEPEAEDFEGHLFDHPDGDPRRYAR